MADTDDAEFPARGWHAIDAALHLFYPGVEPKHYGSALPWRFGGRDPLDGVSVYPRADHWHFVTYGLSELYDKETDDPAVSGWGFEFTFRLARDDDGTGPPNWALNFLQNLARYVVESGNTFEPGHRLDLNGPICLADPSTAIRGVTFVTDPELGEIDTPHGRLRFLQVVGLTLPEYAAAEQWDVDRLLEVLGPHMPLFTTDIGRGNLVDDPAIAAAIAEGAAREGSSTGTLYVATVSAQITAGRTTVTFGANAVERIARLLVGRLPFGRGLLVSGPDAAIGFLTGDQLSIADRGSGLVEIELPPALLTEFVAVLRPAAGAYDLPGASELAVQVVKSQIRGADGSVVAEVG